MSSFGAVVVQPHFHPARVRLEPEVLGLMPMVSAPAPMSPSGVRLMPLSLRRGPTFMFPRKLATYVVAAVRAPLGSVSVGDLPESVVADEDGGEVGEGLEMLGSAFVAAGQAAVVHQPGQG